MSGQEGKKKKSFRFQHYLESSFLVGRKFGAGGSKINRKPTNFQVFNMCREQSIMLHDKCDSRLVGTRGEDELYYALFYLFFSREMWAMCEFFGSYWNLARLFWGDV